MEDLHIAVSLSAISYSAYIRSIDFGIVLDGLPTSLTMLNSDCPRDFGMLPVASK